MKRSLDSKYFGMSDSNVIRTYFGLTYKEAYFELCKISDATRKTFREVMVDIANEIKQAE